ncbi:MAG TPA: hypothetical protein VFN87_17790 [Solirubrobacteraceae bacterium]|nr:hypothetical protein [Solirubrobacteraceae bacterium]
MDARSDRLIVATKALATLGACAAAAWVVQAITASGDYQPGHAVLGDNAAPAIAALVHGHLAVVPSVQPLMGLVSLLWRAPFAGAGVWLGAGPQVVYQLGVAACLLPVLGLVLWLGRRAGSLRHLAAVAAGGALMLAGPMTLQALSVGHPEEVLASVLGTAAVVAASQGRRGGAAALLGLAIGTKPWAALAAPCVLLAIPGGRRAVAILATAVAAPAVALLPAADPGAFRTAEHVIGGQVTATLPSLWWTITGPPVHRLPFSLSRSDIAAIVVPLALGGIWAYGRRLGDGKPPPVDGLALLALLALLRCLVDPAPINYYYVPVVVALATWEAGTRGRLPVLAAAVSASLYLFMKDIAAVQDNTFVLGALNLVWSCGAVALAIHLLRHVFRADQGTRGETKRMGASSPTLGAD